MMKKNKSIIRQLREQLKLSRKDFAKLLQLTGTAIVYYENFERFPRREIAYKIIDIGLRHGFIISMEDLYPRPIIQKK